MLEGHRIVKRITDIGLSLTSLILLSPLLMFISVVIVLIDGRPIFYVSERMRTPNQSFQLIKFRTMRPVEDAANVGVTGGNKADRITATGQFLRRTRLDELPQLINILRGDMSYVGPRPPLRQYTDAHPVLYAQVLQSKPGITGLATLYFHRHEERLIAQTTTAAQTEHIYNTRCIPRKATLDLIYQRHASVCFDGVILWQTILRVLRRR